MPLTDREAFKVGFLRQCAAEGLSAEQIFSRVKQAADLLEKQSFLGGLASGTMRAAGGLANTLGSYGIPMALAAPPILGGLAGYGISKATDIDDTDVDDIKNHELIEEYRRQSERMKRRRAIRDHTVAEQRPGRIFM